MMDKINQVQIVRTADGSKTIFHEESGEHYHSRHGAVGESRHVFIGMGLDYVVQNQNAKPASDGKTVKVLEVGFGTGLNFLMSAAYMAGQDNNLDIRLEYVGVEAFPLPADVLEMLDYTSVIPALVWSSFIDNYESALCEKKSVSDRITLRILPQFILETQLEQDFTLIYFDAFSATHQPEMWTPEVLAHVTQWLVPGGVFVTYSITGSLKRSLKALGFRIEKLPGAPGKREMLRAVKKK